MIWAPPRFARAGLSSLRDRGALEKSLSASRPFGRQSLARSTSDLQGKSAYAKAYASSQERVVTAERRVKIFKNGRNQAVRIPREFELPGEDAVMRKEGERLVIEPAAPPSLLALLSTLKPIEEDFAPISDPVPEPVDL